MITATYTIKTPAATHTITATMSTATFVTLCQTATQMSPATQIIIHSATPAAS